MAIKLEMILTFQNILDQVIQNLAKGCSELYKTKRNLRYL